MYILFQHDAYEVNRRLDLHCGATPVSQNSTPRQVENNGVRLGASSINLQIKIQYRKIVTLILLLFNHFSTSASSQLASIIDAKREMTLLHLRVKRWEKNEGTDMRETR